MLANGMHQAGYDYVNLDDGWQGERDSQGVLHANANFPDMQDLATYLHARGLKFGIYTTMGPKGCNGFTGSLGYEEQDAQTFITWGVDFVKYDACNYHSSDVGAWLLIRKMAEALRVHEAHPIVLSIVLLQSPWKLAPKLSVNMWRIQVDATNTYENMMQIADSDAGLAPYARKTGWNDPDMLQVGRGGMNTEEYRTHMTLWAMLGAPLLAAADLKTISSADLAILTDPTAISINQDTTTLQAKRVSHTPGLDVWLKPLSSGWAVAVVNRSEQAMTYQVDPQKLSITAARVYQAWTGQTVALPYSFALPPHGCVLLKTL